MQTASGDRPKQRCLSPDLFFCFNTWRMAIDKGMPIEQVQKLLGHVRIDTTLRYAIVNQNNVKMAHKKYLG